MLKGYLTKTGSIILAVGGYLATLPQDTVLGTYRGAAVSIGHITAAVGLVITFFGLHRAVVKK